MDVKTCALLSTALTIGVFAWSCGGGPSGTGGAGGAGGQSGGGGAPPVVTTLHPDAAPLPGESACEVVITTGIAEASAVHVPPCTQVDYATNPPSGGDHWPIWAAYNKYESVVVPREMYVHGMEHGSVVLLHRCDAVDVECAQVKSALGAVFDGAPPDSLCMSGPPTRLLLTRDPGIGTPIAAAAWGATYTATCIDPASLADFVADRYGKGLETTCAAGKDVAAPGFDPCPDGGTSDAAAD